MHDSIQQHELNKSGKYIMFTKPYFMYMNIAASVYTLQQEF